MSNPDKVPILDLEVFPSIARSLTFEARHLDDDGADTGPFDLTDKTVIAIFTEIFQEPLILESGADPTDEGSKLEVTDAANGLFNWYLSDEEMERVKQLTGYWRMFLREDDVDDIVLVRGIVTVIPFTAGGTL